MEYKLSPLIGSTECRLDYVGFSGNDVVIVDAKFGRGQTPTHQSSSQMWVYACELQAHRRFCQPDTRFTLTYFSPNSYYDEDDTTRIVSAAEVEAFGDQLKALHVEVNKEIKQRAALLRPGNHCRYCSMLFVCPKLAEAGSSAMNFTNNICDATAIEFYHHAEMLAGLRARLNDYLTERVRAGADVPFKLVESRRRTSWALSDDEMVARLEAMGKEGAALIRTKRQPPTITTARMVKTPHIRDSLKALQKEGASGYHLAPSDDPRPAAAVSGVPKSPQWDRFKRRLKPKNISLPGALDENDDRPPPTEFDDLL